MRLSVFPNPGAASTMLVVGLALSLVPATAEVPEQMVYQGFLKDSEGLPVDGEVNLFFYVYPDSLGGSACWGPEPHIAVSVVTGFFELMLGSNLPGLSDCFDGSIKWIEIWVNGAPLQPRKPIATSAYAFRAPGAAQFDCHDCDDVFVNEGQVDALSTEMIQDRAVTFPKMMRPFLMDNEWEWKWNTYEAQTSMLKIWKPDGSGPLNELLYIYNQEESGGIGDCLQLQASRYNISSNTNVLYVWTTMGRAGYFRKDEDDDEYVVEIKSDCDNCEGIYVRGSVVATGPIGGAVVTRRGTESIYSIQAPDVEVHMSGIARLSGGSAHVQFDELFTEAVSPQVNVRITATPVGGWSALYIEDVSPEGFAIRSSAGEPDVEFHWMACGRRKGYETRPLVAVPDEEG
jgi:hypothetical protein